MERTTARKLTRRSALKSWIALSAPLLLAACSSPTLAAIASAPTLKAPGQARDTNGVSAQPSCVLTPQQTEGPYFVDEKLERSDVRPDTNTGAVSEGAPLRLGLVLTQVTATECLALPNAKIDIWQCDARGVYSDVRDNNWGSSQGQNFLRGYQMTDERGAVEFTTVYPGWYQGRTVHIHFKVRTEDGRETMTSQLYFDDALSDEVFAQEPYAQKGGRRMRNSQDGIYRQNGSQLLVPVTAEGDGYAGQFNLGVRLA